MCGLEVNGLKACFCGHKANPTSTHSYCEIYIRWSWSLPPLTLPWGTAFRYQISSPSSHSGLTRSNGRKCWRKFSSTCVQTPIGVSHTRALPCRLQLGPAPWPRSSTRKSFENSIFKNTYYFRAILAFCMSTDNHHTILAVYTLVESLFVAILLNRVAESISCRCKLHDRFSYSCKFEVQT